jgi:hypothetical protein
VQDGTPVYRNRRLFFRAAPNFRAISGPVLPRGALPGPPRRAIAATAVSPPSTHACVAAVVLLGSVSVCRIRSVP